MGEDPFEVLGVGPDATDEEVRAAYVEGMRRVHPDMEHGDEDSAKRLTAAYTTLHAGMGRSRFDGTPGKGLAAPVSCRSCGPEPEGSFSVGVGEGRLDFRDAFDLDGDLCDACTAEARRDLESRHLAQGPDAITGIFNALGFRMAKRPGDQ